MLGDVAGRVGLDEQVDVAAVLVGRDGRVGADDFLGLTWESGRDRDVLADGKAEDVGWAREGEAVAASNWWLASNDLLFLRPEDRILGPIEGMCIHGSVMRENSLLSEREFLESIGFEHLAGFCTAKVGG